MASNADGSIVIDTELDNEGFERGSDKLLKAVEDLTGAVDNLGDNMMRSFQQVIPLLQNISGITSQVYSSMQGAATQTTQATEQLAQAEQNVNNAVNQTAQAVQSQGQAVSNFTANAGQATTSVSSLEKEVNSLSANMQSISQSAELGFSNGNAVLAFDSKLTAVEQKLDAAKQKLEAFGNTHIPTEDFTWLEQNIAKAEAQLNSYIEKQIQMENGGVSHNSARWKNLQSQIEQTTLMLETYKSEMTDLENSGDAFTLGSDTQQYKQMQQSIQGVEASLQRNRSLIDSEAIAQERLNVLTAQEAVANAQSSSQRQSAIAQLQQAQAQLQATATASSSAAPAEATTKWQRFGAVLKTVASTAGRTAATLARMGFQAVAAGAQKAVSGLKAFASQARRTSGSTGGLVKQLTSLKTMLISKLKYMFISAITQSVGNGIKALAKYSDSFNQAMSNIKNSTSQLGGNLAVSLGGLIQAIEPVLTRIIGLINTAITYLNAFFALLGGKKTMTVAKKSTDSYADSVGGAAAKQKELNRQVYGFDELNKRNKESSSGSGGSGSGSGVQYEEVPIDDVLPESVKDWMERLKEAWKNGDWYGVGQIIAEGLNAAMGVVDDWINNTFRPMGVKWAGIIAQILNGLVDGFNWTLLGKTIADGMNAIADIINTFLTTFNFENLGKGIGKAINGWFDNIEWDLMGQTFANGWNALINTIYGIVSTVDWANIGTSFSEFVNNFFDTIQLEKAAAAIGITLNGITTAVDNFLTKTDWTGIATKVANSVNTLFSTVDWGKMGATVTKGFNTVVQTLATFIGTVDWKGIGASIGQFLQNMITNINWANLGKLLSNAVGGLLDAISGLAESVDWYALGSSITSGLVTFITSIDWVTLIGKLLSALVSLFSGAVELLLGALGGIFSSIGDALEGIGLDCIGGLFKGIGDALKSIGSWLKEHIFDPIVNGIKSLFGIHSPSTVFAELGGYLIQGLLQGIKGAWSTITGFFSGALSGLKSLLSGAWSAIKSTASSAWNGIKSGITSAFTTAKNTVVSVAGNIKSGLSSAWSTVKSGASSAWSSVKTTITTNFNNAKSALSTTASNIKSNLSSTWSNVKSTATQTWSNIKSSVSSTFNNLKSNISTTANGIKTVASNAWSSVKSTASSKWSEIKSTVSSKWSSLKETLKAHDWTSIGTNLVSGLKSGISNAWSSLTSSVGNLCSNLLSKCKSAFGIHSPSKKMAEIGAYLDAGMQQGIENNQGKVLSTAKNLASAVTEGMTPNSPEIDVSSAETVNGISLIADRLSDIAGQFRAIADMLASMGGLRTPEIAQGTVVPYKTKIDTSDTTPVEFEAFKTFSSDVDERMADEIYVLRQILEAIKKLNLNIDISALERAITKQKRGHDLNFGGA